MLSGTAESWITVFTVELQLSSHLSCTFQHEAVTVQLGCLPDEERCCQCSGVLTSTYYFSPAAAAQEVVQISLLLWISVFINWLKKKYIYQIFICFQRIGWSCYIYLCIPAVFTQVSGSFSKASRCLDIGEGDLDFYNTSNMVYRFFPKLLSKVVSDGVINPAW